MKTASTSSPKSSPERLRWLAVWALVAGTACGSESGLPPDPGSALEPVRAGLTASCTGVHSDAGLTRRPVDIIFVIDNSGSMTDEILAIPAPWSKRMARPRSRSYMTA